MLIVSVTEQSGKFHYVYWDMTTVLLINIHCLSSLVTHESLVNFDRISFTLSSLVSRNLGRWVWASTLRVYKVFTKTGQGPWLREDSALGPPSVINCTPLSALSFWVSLIPGTCGYTTLSFPALEASRYQSKHGWPCLIVHAKIINFRISKEPKSGHFRLRSLLV